MSKYKGLALIGAISLLLTGCGVISNVKASEEDTGEEVVTVEQETAQQNQPVELTPQQAVERVYELMETNRGVYAKDRYGVAELPPGEYLIMSVDKGEVYFTEKDIRGVIHSQEGFHKFGYVNVSGLGRVHTNGILISLNALDKSRVKSGMMMYENLFNEPITNIQGLYLKQGYDLEATNYIATSDGEDNYYTLQYVPGKGNIVSKPSYLPVQKGDARIFIELKKGDMLMVEGLMLEIDADKELAIQRELERKEKKEGLTNE